MKIIRKEKNYIEEFGKLGVGDCFEFDGGVYIKLTDDLSNRVLYFGNEINCFCLSYNKLHWISPSTEVRLLNMELREV